MGPAVSTFKGDPSLQVKRRLSKLRRADLALKKVAGGIQYKTVHPISNKVHYFPSEHTCTLLVKLTPLFGVAPLPACPNWSGVDQSMGLMDRPAWLWTKPALLLALVLMCFLYWQQGYMTARRRRWRRVKGSQGA